MFNAVKIGNEYDYNYREFVCDTIEDLHAIKTRRLATGSKATVLKDEGDKQQHYVLTGNREWIVDTATGGAAVQPDWAQNDEAAPDYVKNRPGGYDTVIEENVTLNITSSEESYKHDGVYTLKCDNLFRKYATSYGETVGVGTDYLGTSDFVDVEYNGVMYKNVPVYRRAPEGYVNFWGPWCGNYMYRYTDNGAPKEGDPTKYPFYIGVDYNMGLGTIDSYIFADAETPTIKITRYVDMPMEIPAKYLEAVQADWLQSYDTEKDYIKNKPDVVTFSGSGKDRWANARKNIYAARGGDYVNMESEKDLITILGRKNVKNSYAYYYDINDYGFTYTFNLSTEVSGCSRRYTFDFENEGFNFNQDDIFTPTKDSAHFYLLDKGYANPTLYYVFNVISIDTSIKFKGIWIKKYKSDEDSSYSYRGRICRFPFIVGNGLDDEGSNAHTLDWEGNAWYSGDVYVGSTSGTNRDEGSKKLATEEYVDKMADEVASSVYFYYSFGKFCGKEVTEIGPNSAYDLAKSLISSGHNPYTQDTASEATANIISISVDENNIYGRYIAGDGTIGTVTVAKSVFTGADMAPS